MKLHLLNIVWILQYQLLVICFGETFDIKQHCWVHNFVISCKQNLSSKILNFDQLNGTYKLFLKNTELKTLQDNVFQNITLEELSVINNPLTYISKDAFKGQEDSLKVVHLSTTSDVQLDFTALENLYKLEYLKIENFKLNTTLNNLNFVNLSNLRTLYLQNNGIPFLNKNVFRHLGNLTKLYLPDNKFQTIPLPSIFGKIPNLEYLDMNDNNITKISSYNLKECPRLAELHLKENSIKDIEEKAFDGIENSLRRLDLRLNVINQNHLIQFQNLSMLEYLNLGSNRIKALPSKTFKNMNSLKCLTLKTNQITKLKRTILYGLKNLTTLYLDKNHLIIIENGTLADVPQLHTLYFQDQILKEPLQMEWLKDTSQSLQKLDLKNNNINATTLWPAIQTLSKLEFLDISQCSLSQIPDFAFEQNLKLKKLKLAGNKLQSLQEEAFQGLQNSLESIDLSSNLFEVIDECLFRNFSWSYQDTFNINIDNNALICNCSLLWLQNQIKEYLKVNSFSQAQYWKCLSPQSQKEKIKEANLTCKSNITQNNCKDFSSRYITSPPTHSTQVLSTKETTTITVTTSTTTEPKKVTTQAKPLPPTTPTTPPPTTPTTPPPTTPSPITIPSTTKFSPKKPTISITLRKLSSKDVEISWNISNLLYVKDFNLSITEILENGEEKKTLKPIHKLTKSKELYNLNLGSIYHICIIVNLNFRTNMLDACDTLNLARSEPSKKEKTIYIEASIGVSVVILLALIIGLAYILYKRRTSQRDHTYEEPKPKPKPNQVTLTPKSKRYERQKKPEGQEPTVTVISQGKLEPMKHLSAGSYQYLANPNLEYDEIQVPDLLRDNVIQKEQEPRNRNGSQINSNKNGENLQNQKLSVNALGRQSMNHIKRPLPNPPGYQNSKDFSGEAEPTYDNIQAHYAVIHNSETNV